MSAPHSRTGSLIKDLLPTEIDGFDSLAELALDMRWSWNHAADEVWRELDPVLWDLTHHPWDVLQTVSREKVRDLLADAAFRAKIDALVQTREQSEKASAWFQRNHPKAPLACVAYFSMEFMLSEAIPEAYAPEVGWALGDGREHGDDPEWDAIEADALYGLLEREVVPEFFDRDKNGIPAAWVARMRESMARLTPRFSSDRAVREYTEQHYLPSAAAYKARAENNGAAGRLMVDWRNSLERKWERLRFGDVKVETRDAQHLFEVQVFLDDLDPSAVRVELFAEGDKDGQSVRREMQLLSPPAGIAAFSVYSAHFPAARPASDYTARLIPRHHGASIPLEAEKILWQR